MFIGFWEKQAPFNLALRLAPRKRVDFMDLSELKGARYITDC
jgi:hypothetical protein